MADHLLVALKDMAGKPTDREGWAMPTGWLAHHNIELAERGLVEVVSKTQARVTEAGKNAAKQGYAGERGKGE